MGMHPGLLIKVTKFRMNRRQQREGEGEYSEEMLLGMDSTYCGWNFKFGDEKLVMHVAEEISRGQFWRHIEDFELFLCLNIYLSTLMPLFCDIY